MHETLLLAAAGPARQLAKDLAGHWSYWESYRDDPGSRATALEHDPTPEACEAAVAKARKTGLGDDAKIELWVRQGKPTR